MIFPSPSKTMPDPVLPLGTPRIDVIVSPALPNVWSIEPLALILIRVKGFSVTARFGNPVRSLPFWTTSSAYRVSV